MQYNTVPIIHYCVRVPREIIIIISVRYNVRIKVPPAIHVPTVAMAIKRNFCGVIRRRIYKYATNLINSLPTLVAPIRFKLYTHYVCCIPRVHVNANLQPEMFVSASPGRTPPPPPTRPNPDDINSCRLIRV